MERKKSIIDFVTANKNIIYLLLCMLIGVGVFGLTKMNKDEFPTFEIKQGLIAAVYPGATSEQVMEEVGKPLEQMLFSFQEVNRNNLKISCQDGLCYILTDLNTPMSEKDRVWSKIKLKIEDVKMTLPQGVLAVVVMDDFSSVSTSLIAIESSDKTPSELKDYATALCDELRKIPSLAKATVYGERGEEIAVTLDAARLAEYSLSPSQILLDIKTSDLKLPSGSLNTEGARLNVHVSSPFSGEQEIADKIIYSDPLGGSLRVKDIATVERCTSSPSSYVNYNGNSAIIISVEMLPGNNVIEFGKQMDKTLDTFRSPLPDSVSVSKITDQPRVVGRSVFSFLRDLLISILVVIGVMLMLFPFRSAAIASSGVPVCTAIALAVMYLTRMELNTVSLAALIVVLGMIVDDSIITMDGYMNHLSLGKSRKDAARDSARELILPMFMATAAISLMFFPCLGIISGYLGEFVSIFPWVILIALFASLAYAVFVVPNLEIRFIRNARHTGGGPLSKIQNRFFDALQHGYDRIQDKCFAHQGLTLALGAGSVLLGLFIFSRLTVQMMPEADRDFFAMEVNLDAGSGLEDTRAVVDSLESIMLKDSRVKSATSFIGSSAPRFNATYPPATPAPNFAQLIVNTKSLKATSELIPLYEKTLEHLFPQALVRVKQMDYQGVVPIEIMLYGEDRYALTQTASQIEGYMRSLDDELKWVHSTSDESVNWANVILDPVEAARLGVNKSLMSLSLAANLQGQTIASLSEAGEQIPVKLYSRDKDAPVNAEDLLDLPVATSIPSVSVPLRQVASITPEWESKELVRYGGKDAVIISADMKYQKSQPVSAAKIRAFVDTLELPQGVSVEFNGLSSVNEGVIPEIALSFICAVLVLFFFLLFHFKKISLACLTIGISTLCFFGAFFGLWIFSLDFSITAVLGLISLVGIIVRNGIILFDYAEELRRDEGMSVREAAALAGKRRMRPIFLTSLTTALGVLPMILSHDNLWMPMGVVICFGTLLSIALITLIMPIAYSHIFSRGEKRLKRTQDEA